MESILSLEITEDKIRILELCATEKGLELLRLDKLDLPPNCIKEGIIAEPKLVSEKLFNFIKENNISAKKTVVLINPPNVFIRLIRLPHNLSDEQIRINLEAEVNQYQAFAGKDTIIAFKKIEEISEEGIKKINVLFASTFKALTDSYLKALDWAGLDLIAVDAPIFSILRLLEDVDFNPASLDANLLMVVGERYLDTCIVKGNRMRFLHSVEIDTYDFEKDKVNFVEKIVSAIKLVINFYQTRFVQGEQIVSILINPLDARLNGLDKLLQEKLPQLPIKFSNPLNKIYVNEDKFRNVEQLRFDFSALLGASLRIESKDQSFNLELLHEQRIKRQRRLNQIFLLFISLTVVFVTMLASLGWVVLRINILQMKEAKLAAKLEQLSPELNAAMAIKEKKEILQKQLDEALSISADISRPFYFRNIAKAMTLVSKDLWLNNASLDTENKNLILTGQSHTENYIFEYISKLKHCGYFNSAELASSENETDSIKFVIRCAIR